MSSVQSATNVAHVSVAGEIALSGEKVVQFPAQGQEGQPAPVVEITDHKVHPLTKAAHDLYYKPINEYTDASGRKHMECRRHYIPLPAIWDITSASGHQMTVDELNVLFGLDGDPVNCSVTAREFQPVWWTIINDRLLDAIYRNKAIDERTLSFAQAIQVGQFFPNPDRDAIEQFAVSGVAYYWTKEADCLAAFWSPLRRVSKFNNNEFGVCHLVSDEILAERKAQRDEVEQTRLGLSRLEDAFKKKANDRRQFFKPTKRS